MTLSYGFGLARLFVVVSTLSMMPQLCLAQSAQDEIGASAYPFDLSQVRLTDSRWMDNQGRTVSYLLDVDTDRLLYNFRSNHGLSTNGATANGGWDAPTFPFRTHSQGHFLTAWAQCYATLGNSECGSRATSFVAELAKCQQNNAAQGFNDGYLSGFPESEFDNLEGGSLSSGNVPYYVIHKTLAGLLDVWTILGDDTAKDVLLSLAGWVDFRTGRLSYDQMQRVLGTEFGGMNEVMADIFHQTGDQNWLTVAQRFDHAAVFDPLAGNQDNLNGLHANTQVPKWIGAIREYKATGTERYRDIGTNAWDMTVHHHSYAIGGNSQAEHFRAPDQISGYLEKDTCESCNSYNMLKLTRELFTLDPSDASYFDFYEKALMNHLLGIQDPSNNHGHITYFTPLNAGGRRGVGPAWGGGTYSTDYDSFWCCQGTGLETNTKLADSIYFHSDDTLYVNLFTPSTLEWSDRSVSIKQSTKFPDADTTSLEVSGSGDWTMAIRIPFWTKGATITVNGEDAGVSTDPGTYAMVSRSWSSGDTVDVQLPMHLYTAPANDDSGLAALAFGPVTLAGNYGDSSLNSPPTIDLSSVQRSGSDGLDFSAKADGSDVSLGPFFNAHGFNYNVYWKVAGSLE